jgi:hypothetical protein
VCFKKDGSFAAGLLVLFSEKSAFDDAEQEKQVQVFPNQGPRLETSRRICNDPISTFEDSRRLDI